MIRIQKSNGCVRINENIYPMNSLIIDVSGEDIRLMTTSMKVVSPFYHFSDYIWGEDEMPKNVEETTNLIAREVYAL